MGSDVTTISHRFEMTSFKRKIADNNLIFFLILSGQKQEVILKLLFHWQSWSRFHLVDEKISNTPVKLPQFSGISDSAPGEDIVHDPI